MSIERRVTHAEQRSAQHANNLHLVIRVRERPEQGGEYVHLFGVTERAGAAHLHGYTLRIHRPCVLGEVALLPG